MMPSSGPWIKWEILILSDDAVVVLVTKNPYQEESEFEYRVSYTNDLEKLYGIFDPITGKWKGDNGVILDLFCEQTVFTELDEAVEYAHTSVREVAEPDFGIVVLKDFQTKHFHDL
jgi:hypothetical protein